MADCPNCGQYMEVDRAQVEEIVCPNCKITLRAFTSRNVGYAVFSFFVLMIVVGVVAWILTNVFYVFLIPFAFAMFSIRLAMYATSLEVISPKSCSHCGRAIVLEGSKFCPNCGTNFLSGVAYETVTTKRQVVSTGLGTKLKRKGSRTCTVCNLVIKPDDEVAWCPHCGNPAHRVHLLEWLHVKKYCPMCKEHLDEKELTKQLSVKPVRLKAGKASRKRQTRKRRTR